MVAEVLDEPAHQMSERIHERLQEVEAGTDSAANNEWLTLARANGDPQGLIADADLLGNLPHVYRTTTSATHAGRSTPAIAIVTPKFTSSDSAPRSSRDQRHGAGKSRIDGKHSGKAHPVEAIVDCGLHALEDDGLRQKQGDQGQRQVTIGARCPERPSLGPVGVDVNPLTVLGVLGEAVDPIMVDRDPAAGREMLTDVIHQSCRVLEPRDASFQAIGMHSDVGSRDEWL